MLLVSELYEHLLWNVKMRGFVLMRTRRLTPVRGSKLFAYCYQSNMVIYRKGKPRPRNGQYDVVFEAGNA